MVELMGITTSTFLSQISEFIFSSNGPVVISVIFLSKIWSVI